MQRRNFLAKAAVGAAAVGLAACGQKEEPKAAAPAGSAAPATTAAPAVKGSLPEVK
ncbi:MAG: twin-arginine translocation signal domain-containing protein, partial [Azonexus sp.]